MIDAPGSSRHPVGSLVYRIISGQVRTPFDLRGIYLFCVLIWVCSVLVSRCDTFGRDSILKLTCGLLGIERKRFCKIRKSVITCMSRLVCPFFHILCESVMTLAVRTRCRSLLAIMGNLHRCSQYVDKSVYAFGEGPLS